MPRMKLLEVGKDIQIIRNFVTHKGRYKRVMHIGLREEKADISEYDFSYFAYYLQQKYPDKDYRWAKRKIGGKTYLVLRRGKYSYKSVPLYYCMNDGKFYVPASYVSREPRLTSTMLDITLGYLGVPLRKTSVKA